MLNSVGLVHKVWVSVTDGLGWAVLIYVNPISEV